jgi:ABC-type transport system involved in cytochrome c biogenesis permease subunit
MSWYLYNYLGPLSVLFFLTGAVMALKKNEKASLFIFLGTIVTLIFIVLLWISLTRPPFRTMGETRLWYSFFLSTGGILAYRRFGYSWLLSFGAVVASVFALVNLLKPEIHSKALMPALQSPYFIPHVTLYILSYAVLAASAVGSVLILISRRNAKKNKGPQESAGDGLGEDAGDGLREDAEEALIKGAEETPDNSLSSGPTLALDNNPEEHPRENPYATEEKAPDISPPKDSIKGLYDLVDNLTYVGTGFLMLGLILGALWAKEAWGHYWSWDPKETWAFTTAAAFLLYIHLRRILSKSYAPLLVLPLAFVFLMITWLGVNFLPTANLSVHAY